MTVKFKCVLNLSEYDYLTAADIDKVKAELDKARYDWYHDGDELEISGECEVNEEFTDAANAADVASEIKWLLRDAADIDADIDVEERYDEDFYRESAFDEERRYYYSGLA